MTIHACGAVCPQDLGVHCSCCAAGCIRTTKTIASQHSGEIFACDNCRKGAALEDSLRSKLRDANKIIDDLMCDKASALAGEAEQRQACARLSLQVSELQSQHIQQSAKCYRCCSCFMCTSQRQNAALGNQGCR